MLNLTGVEWNDRPVSRKKEAETARKNFIPYLKEKLIWS
jgi:hypothetical protein